MTPDPLPLPPAAPAPESCCRRGCEPCIFDYYARAFSAWEAEIRALGHAPEDVLAALGEVRAARPRLSSL